MQDSVIFVRDKLLNTLRTALHYCIISQAKSKAKCSIDSSRLLIEEAILIISQYQLSNCNDSPISIEANCLIKFIQI